MNIPILSYRIAFVCFTLSTAVMAQQAKKDAVILYNSVPVEVELSANGDINRFIKEKPDHLVGYTIDTKPSDPAKAIANLTDPNNAREFGSPVSPERDVIYFAEGVNTLNAAGIETLEIAVFRLSTEKGTSVILKAAQTDNPATNTIHEQRLNSCKQFLASKGIPAERIQTMLTPAIKQAERLTLTFTVE